MINEDFLYYLWKFRKFNFENLKTCDGEAIEVQDTGEQNTDSGPDFLNAKVKIGNTVWYGNIEMHIYSSDWEKHRHDQDPAYNSVILHVVYEHDQICKTQSGITLPCLELKSRISKIDLRNYKLLRFNKNWIPCEKLFPDISGISKISAMEKSLSDRLLRKSFRLKEILEKNKYDWEESFFVYMSRYFGMKLNSDAFEMLAMSCTLKTILREKDNLKRIEALLFGQAGFLNEIFVDDYPQELKTEYNHLKIKYDLIQVPVSIWKFSRLRPSNFPAVRIALLAKLLFQNNNIFEKVISGNKLEDFKKLFLTTGSEYWEDHYNFDALSEKKIKKAGKTSVDVLIINTVVPAIFLYGHLNDSEKHKETALNILNELPAETNSIITKWKTLGLDVNTAYDSQALIELKLNNCNVHKCLHCPIGFEIMKSN